MRKTLSYSIVTCLVLLFSLSVSHADGIIYNDLGSGNQYFKEDIFDTGSAIDTTLELDLSSFAISDINGLGSLFTIGLTFIEPIPPDETVQFGAGSLLLNGTYMFSMLDQGTYREDGYHNDSDPTTIGYIGGMNHNAFYLFDLTSFVGNVDSAKFSVYIEDIETHVGALAFAGYAVGEPVPEPTTMLLFGTGLAGLAGVARRKKTDL